MIKKICKKCEKSMFPFIGNGNWLCNNVVNALGNPGMVNEKTEDYENCIYAVEQLMEMEKQEHKVGYEGLYD